MLNIPFFKSSRVKITDGIKNKIIKVANAIPKTIVIAIGIKNCACKLFSNKSGVNPPIVVAEVKRTALNLSQLPLTTASSSDSCSALSSILRTSTIESFINIPESPNIAKKLSMVRSKPSTKWPKTVPIKPKGITEITTNGLV